MTTNRAGGSQPPSREVPALEAARLALGMRRLLWFAGLLVFLAGVQLFVFTERTATHFAWTIEVPLTAAFLGAAYWASAVFEWRAARELLWANARIAVPTVFLFTTLTLIATLLHLDLFHLGGAFSLATQAVTWAWIAIYAFVPVAMVSVAIGQRRAARLDPPRTSVLAGWVVALLLGQALVMFVVGAWLFLEPGAASLWPWALTPLTGRAVGAWVLGLALCAAHCLLEKDARRLRPAAAGYLAFPILQAVALARYPDAIEWGSVQATLYFVFLVGFVVTGAALSFAKPALRAA